jgi:hypothetical protein
VSWARGSAQPRMWLGVGFFMLAAGAQRWWPQHDRRRETLLADASHGDDGTGGSRS